MYYLSLSKLSNNYLARSSPSLMFMASLTSFEGLNFLTLFDGYVLMFIDNLDLYGDLISIVPMAVSTGT